MAISILIHIANQEPIMAEIEEMPTAGDTVLVFNNPRKRDGKDISFILEGVTTVIWPWAQINFVEVLPSEGEDEVIGFVRE
jgi:hypothetical protein